MKVVAAPALGENICVCSPDLVILQARKKSPVPGAPEIQYSMPILKDNKKYCFAMEMVVRDYELDSQDIVNNANYLHYMEHTRHTFCAEAGMSFGDLHKMGIDPVVRKVEIEYKTSLRVNDRFISALKVERKGPRFVFKQDIIFPNGEFAARATVTVVAIKDGKLSKGDELYSFFGQYMK